MWILIKNVLNSLKKNKLSIFGLIFLVFLAVSIFTGADGTTTAINNVYKSISKKGNLHDFTVSELYNVGVVKYANNIEEETIDEVSNKNYLYNNNLLVKSNDQTDPLLFPYINAIKNQKKENEYILTIHYLLAIDQIANKTSLKNFYLSALQNQELWNKYAYLLSPTIVYATNITDQELITYLTSTQKAYGKDSQEITALSASQITTLFNKLDFAQVNFQLNNLTNEIYEVVGSVGTPIVQYLDDTETGLGNDVKWRNFKSLNIANSSDQIFYKMVQSNPNDEIDKMCLIDPLIGKNNIQWNNFLKSECDYGVLNPEFNQNYGLSDTLNYIPLLEPSETTIDHNYLEKIFLLTKGDWGSSPETVIMYRLLKKFFDDGKIPDVITVPQTKTEREEWWTKNIANVKKLYKGEKSSNEQIYVKDHRITIQWTSALGTPSSYVLENWTSLFTVVNPEYMQINNMHTMDEAMFNQEDSYKQYIIAHPEITNQRQQFIGWLNSLKYPDLQTWFDKVTNSKSQFSSCVVNPGGSIPFIIVGSGITPDFIYPIVSISKSTPNPNSEAIVFANDSGYARVFDAYRSNESENYIIGKFVSKNHKNQQKILDQINAYAEQKMTFPHRIKAAYLALDTSNTLNASAFRISYIPKFIQTINSVSIGLTIFVVILSLLICCIVIQCYIFNMQSTLGIMQANGISKWAIATSLIPFALIPTILGGILGLIAGTLMELPLLKLLKTYWMLPTLTTGFSWIGLLIAIVISFAVFMTIIYVTTFFALGQNTVDLMKSNSQDKANIVARAAKKTFNKFGVITKFRIAVAFNSLWKLLVLVIMTSLTLSSLVFALSINWRIEKVTQATDSSRKYTYAIKMPTPTLEGGQYIPINYDIDSETSNQFNGFGISGFQQAGNDNRDYNYIQSIYYGFGGSWKTKALFSEIDVVVKSLDYAAGSMPEVEIDNPLAEGKITLPLNQILNKPIYGSSWGYYAKFGGGGTPEEQIANFRSAITLNNNLYSNFFWPYLGDAPGQQIDLIYLKNRVMAKSAIDHVVGGLGMVSNPWDIAESLMPENTKHTADSKQHDFIDFIGETLYYEEAKSDPKYKSLYEKINNAWTDASGQACGIVTCKPFIVNTQIPSGVTYKYRIDKNAVHQAVAVALKLDFLKLLTICYADPICAANDYSFYYNQVPLTKSDETYTNIEANVVSDNASVSIMGIKASNGYKTQYINLVDKNGNDLLNKLSYTKEDYLANKPFPIVANEYAKHKYNLKIGSKISFDVNNRADRIAHQMKIDNNIDDPNWNNRVEFTIVGFCNTYEDQEYYCEQDIANKVLMLKSHLDDGLDVQKSSQPHHYYLNQWKSLGNKVCQDGYFNVVPNSDGLKNSADDNAAIFDLSNYDSKYNLTPYGFNGIFTNASDGGQVLSKSTILYSPSGIYPGNDKITSNTVNKMLQYGANVQIASKFALDQNIPLAKKIAVAYDNWQKAIGTETQAAAHKELTSLTSDLVGLIQSYYGSTAYESLVTGVIDKVSQQIVYSNMSKTINQLTVAISVIVGFMVIVIVSLITNMVINDSKRLAALLKTLGYTDGENAANFLSIYASVIILGLLVAGLLTWGLVSIYNAAIFNGLKLWLDTQIKWYYYGFNLLAILALFGLSIINSVIFLKRERLVDSIKS